ncbi:Type III restriction-modification system methylation subunit [Vibrio jasicida]|uniref:site-specific DNA-methyltransferase (adenine-specific) n=1 Tax=Vibrio jasicida TaxID=766224 RepID=A0AAU9QY17_9VIBR|nr:Type III restriction-modification system methylation subunit [Vibrio jasicida]CAH1603957.1 Type III restriction-modification system methylation subunit [Vibrio jasicida]
MSEMEKITGSSPEAKSLDITNQNIEQLKQLFPDVFSEGKIDFEALRAVLGEEVDDSEERYNFTWNGKTKARQIAQTPSTGTLRPCKDESVNWDTTENLFIEGDNLEVLKLLQKSYHKKVKMIYIDPPYNTGKDFVYKDNFHDNIKNYLEVSGQVDASGNKISTNSETSGRYHSDWLNMMYPRLKLARNLLKDDGVIFISLDENEIMNLTALCNEIFGEDNFIERFIWKSGRTSSSIYTREHEYILAYAKNIELLPHISYKGEDSLISDRAIKKVGVKNPASEIVFPSGIRFEGEDKIFPNTFGDKEVVEVSSGTFECKDGKLAHTVTLKAGWTMKSQIENWLKGSETVDSKGQKVIEFFFKPNGVLQYVKQRGTEHPKTIITDFTTKQGSKEVEELLASGVFDYPKPTGLIQHLLKIVEDDDIVMDFFAGSNSTAHAVIKKNMEDGINRKFISVQLPEPITTNVAATKYCKENGLPLKISSLSLMRLKNAIKEATIDIGVKTFKLDQTNIRPWDADFENLELVLQQAEKSIKADRSSEDVLYEIFLKYGYDLTTPVETEIVNGKTVFVVGAGALFVCLDDEITTDTVEGIAKLKEEYDPETTQVVFKDEGFADDRVKTNAIQILKQAAIDDVKSI